MTTLIAEPVAPTGPAPPAATPVAPALPAVTPAPVVAATPSSPAPAATPPGPPGTAQTAPPAAAIEYEVSVPEGLEVDDELVKQFFPLAKEAGLTQEQVQKFADFYTNSIQARHDAWDARVADWEKTAMADKEMGGANREKNLVIAQQAMKRFATPGFVELVTELGIYKHPEVERLFFRVGERMREDRLGGAPGSAAGEPDEQSRLRSAYPTMYPKET